MPTQQPIARRTLLGALASAAVVTALGATVSAPALAQSNYPDRPVKITIPFPPGGSNDNLGRALAQALAVRLKQPFVVENKGGAGTIIGTDYVAKSAPDGYNLLFISSSVSTNAASGKKMPFDTFKDLEPIARIGSGPLVMVAANKLNIKTWGEWVEYAKKNPGKVNYGTAGIGTLQHLATELINITAGINVTHVPYKGGGPAFTDIMSGNLQVLLASLNAALPHIKGNTMRALAVTSGKRSPLAPEIPTLDESGLKGFALDLWWSMFGPAGMNKAVVTKLNDNIAAIVAEPQMTELLAREGASNVVSKPEELAALLRSDTMRWAKVIKEANIPTD